MPLSSGLVLSHFESCCWTVPLHQKVTEYLLAFSGHVTTQGAPHPTTLNTAQECLNDAGVRDQTGTSTDGSDHTPTCRQTCDASRWLFYI